MKVLQNPVAQFRVADRERRGLLQQCARVAAELPGTVRTLLDLAGVVGHRGFHSKLRGAPEVPPGEMAIAVSPRLPMRTPGLLDLVLEGAWRLTNRVPALRVA